MNRKKIIRLVIFAIIFIVIDQSIGVAIANLAQKRKFDKRIGLLINNELPKDILIIGSSRALNGLDPETITKETNLSCFNMGVSGSNVLFHETILELVIATKHLPKVIVYTVDDDATLIDLGDLIIYRKDELYPYVNNWLVNKKVSNSLDKELWATSASSTYRNNVNFMNAIKYLTKGVEEPDWETTNVDVNGTNLLIGKSANKKMRAWIDRKAKFDLTNEYIPYAESFSRIISKCKDNHINLVLVLPPLYYSSTVGFKERIIELSNNNALVVDYSNHFKDKELNFYNNDHLNKDGAIEYSKLLSKEILNVIKK